MRSSAWLSIVSTVLAPIAFAACGNGAASPAPAMPIAVASTSKLQLGVGTATINTDYGSVVGTNFTMTFRGPSGNNATGVNVPTLTGPPNFKIGFPGTVNSIHGLSQLAFSNDLQSGTFPTDFQESLGPYVGVFGYGLANDNLVSTHLSEEANTLAASRGGQFCTDLQSSGDPTRADGNVEKTSTFINGNAITLATDSAVSSEIGLPLGSANQNLAAVNCPTAASLSPLFSGPNLSSDPNQGIFPVNYYGGPPAWPSPQGYGAPTYFLGFSLGFTDTPAAPIAGSYTLGVSYPTASDYSSSATVTATAQLRSVSPLPLMPKPSLRVNADGSGVVSIVIPSGLFESIVEVRTTDCRNATSQTNQDNNFSQVVRTSGFQDVFFAANLGPPGAGGTPSRTFCAAGSSATVSVLGFDYPAYESSYPFDNSMAPKITNGDGHTGQADVTTSPPLIYSQPVNGSSHRRRSRT